MELHLGKNTLRIGRNTWSWLVWYSLAQNIGVGEINRIDRKCLGFRFVDLVCGPIHFEFYRDLN